jgi:hypothetical protein
MSRNDNQEKTTGQPQRLNFTFIAPRLSLRCHYRKRSALPDNNAEIRARPQLALVPEYGAQNRNPCCLAINFLDSTCVKLVS